MPPVPSDNPADRGLEREFFRFFSVSPYQGRETMTIFNIFLDCALNDPLEMSNIEYPISNVELKQEIARLR
jgi:hypothetical protein